MLKTTIKLLNHYKRLVKFAIAGVTATATHFTVLAVLTEVFGVHYLASATTGFLVAFWVSFFLQKFWTFRDGEKRGMARQIAFYFCLMLTGMGLNAAGMYALVDGLGVYYLLAQLVMSGSIAIFNFLVNKYFIFARAIHDQAAPRSGRSVLIATPIFPPDIGGPATYAMTLCEELPKRGWEVGVVTYGNVCKSEIRNPKSETNPKHEILKNQAIENLNIDNSLDIGYWILDIIDKQQGLLLKYLKYFLAVFKHAPSADIVFLQDPVNAGWPAALACYLRAKPYIIKVVGDYAWEHAQECHGATVSLDEFQGQEYGGKVGLIRRIQRWVVRNAEAVITPSEYLKGIVGGWGVDASRIRVIYNSVKEANVALSREECRAKHGISGWTLVSVGRLLPWKGFNALIDLMPVIANRQQAVKQSRGFSDVPGIASAAGPRNDSIHLVIIGDGPERANVEKKISESPAKDRIRFIPGLPQGELWERIKACDAFILNTGYEGLPHIVIEAQMLSLPVITTAAGGNREVVTDGVNGLVVGHDDKESIKAAILKLYNDQELAGRLVEGGKRGLEKFGRERMIDEIIKVFVIASEAKQSRD